MKKIYLLLAFVLALSTQFVVAQRTITGTITADGAKKESLIGAAVVVKGTTTGTVTDVDGKFSLVVPQDATTLAVSLVGYASQEVSIVGTNAVNIVLTEGAALQELVVVGYTTQKKQDLTGAVAVVELAPIKNNSSGNAMQALQGRVAGLYIEKDGSPNGSNGRILIRGANTFGINASF